MKDTNSKSILEEVLERAKNMPQLPLRYILFKIPIALVEELPISFKKDEFVIIEENYGYLASASVVRDGMLFYLSDLQEQGIKFKVFIEED